MKKKEKKIISITVSVIVVAVTGGIIYYYNIQTLPEDMKTQWISSGPFAIDKPKYKLGEDVFLTVHGLKPNEAGNIIFMIPDGRVWTEIPFNGTLKTDFSYYFKPDTSSHLKILSPDELVGTWKAVFQGVPYASISFEFTHEFIKGAENDVVPLNPNETKAIGPTQQ